MGKAVRLTAATTTSLGTRIKSERLARGFTVSQFAKMTNVTPTAVNNWEDRGRTPRPLALTAICKSLGVSEAYLTTGNGPTSTGAITKVDKTKEVDGILSDAIVKLSAETGMQASRLRLSLSFR